MLKEEEVRRKQSLKQCQESVRIDYMSGYGWVVFHNGILMRNTESFMLNDCKRLANRLRKLHCGKFMTRKEKYLRD